MLKKLENFGSGVRKKPEKCKLCPMYYKGIGFCEDSEPTSPKIAYIFDTPGSDDVLDQHPFSGPQGYAWDKLLISGLGWKKEEVLLSHILRCKQTATKFGKPEYPTAWLQKQSELNCRRFDEQLIAFDPNVFVITVHPRDIRLIGCYQPQIVRDCEKAKEFAFKGYRPAVLFGQNVAKLYYPWADKMGGIKNCRGHWWIGEYPFSEGFKEDKKRGFVGV